MHPFSSIAGVLFTLAASTSHAAGTVRVDFGALSGPERGSVQVELTRMDLASPQLAYRGDGLAIGHEGVPVEPGTYCAYLEDEGTGFLLALDNGGVGYSVAEGKTAVIPATDFADRVAGVKAKDRQEREAQPIGAPGGTFVLGGGGPTAGPAVEFAPGELLIKYSATATLAQRYQLLAEIAAEGRNKLRAIGVYRVRVAPGADLDGLIRSHAADPRIAYIEKNGVVSVPRPGELSPEGR